MVVGVGVKVPSEDGAVRGLRVRVREDEEGGDGYATGGGGGGGGVERLDTELLMPTNSILRSTMRVALRIVMPFSRGWTERGTETKS